VNEQGRRWGWFGWALFLIGAAAAVIIAATPARSQTYHPAHYPQPVAYATGNYITIAAYGAGFIPAADAPGPAGQQPSTNGTDNAELIRELIRQNRELQQRLDRLLRILEKDAPEPAAGAAGQEGEDAGGDAPELFARADFTQAEMESVVKKIRSNKMPPPDSGFSLTAAERSNFAAAFAGQRFDAEALGRSYGQCIACHAETANYKKAGGGFRMFVRQPRK
jgi:hypothetical protein